MRALWSTIIAPLLRSYEPSSIVEFSREGENLGAILVEAAEEYGGAVVDLRASDPEHPDAAPDLALIHGEPNWYSVSQCLERLGEMAAAARAPFAVTLVHGVDWPTGRRDAYPDPDAIPRTARQAHAPGRPLPGRGALELAPEPGTIGRVERALDEHDRRNGVLTAVENFLASAEEELELVHVPGFGGVAILLSTRRLEGGKGAALRGLVDGFRLETPALAQLAALEAARLATEARSTELQADALGVGGAAKNGAEAELETLRARLDELAGHGAELREAIARRDARIAALEVEREAATHAGFSASDRIVRLEVNRGLEEVATDWAPLPRDRAGILVGAGEQAPAGDPPPVDVIVRATGAADQLCRSLWSLLSRSHHRLRLTIAVDENTTDVARRLVDTVAAVEPAVTVTVGDPDPSDPAGRRLLVDQPVVFAHGALDALLAAAEGRDGRSVAAVSASALGVPSWAGPDSVALLLRGAVDSDSMDEVAAACIVAPPGAREREPDLVALDGVVEDGAQPVRPFPTSLRWLDDAFGDERTLSDAVRERLSDPLSVAYVLPGLPPEGSGGSHSIFQEAAAMRACGIRVRIAIEQGFVQRAIALYGDAADLIAGFDSQPALEPVLEGFDVVIATESPSAPLVAAHVERRPDVLGAYYVQDYEPLFSDEGGPRGDVAALSYRQSEGLLHFAKTHWIANVVAAAHGIPVAKVDPSLDGSLFNADGRRPGSRGVMRVLAMVRPRTPRRRPLETVRALARIKRELGGRVECLAFGCGRDEFEELRGSLAARDVAHLGVLTREEVAEVLRRCDVFLDLSSYQAFGRTGLEAMACGAVPILPDAGGAREFAVDGSNCVVLDTGDEDGVLAAVAALIENPDRLERLRANGYDTARSYSVTKAALSQYALFRAAMRARR